MIRVIAEAGQCMEGSIDKARAMADAARRAGCWGFKVQLLQPETIAATDSPLYWKPKSGATTQQGVFRRAGCIPYNQWYKVAEHCYRIGLEFLATPFDLDAVQALVDMECKYVKVASGDVTNEQLLEAVADSKMHAILSTGASTLKEVRDAVTTLGRTPAAVLACSLIYPTPIEEAHLGRISTLSRIYGRGRVGYSDHTEGTHTGLAAAAAGASWLEKHFTLGGDPAKVPDHAMALHPGEMEDYVRLARMGERLRGQAGVWPTEAEKVARRGARRTLYWAGDGVQIPPDVIALRPAPEEGSTQVGAENLSLVRSLQLARPVRAGEPVVWEDLQAVPTRPMQYHL